eukprot:CAMPEP_0179163642 /NCGR_PEP_ID=MMETSP0796-20121207/80252_1 /TAXON_ID=73915 /ORGANISM="Pyrodinium bahamense, Strain pbaha01" /LENGTH=44 /DNA_ID= /DNA_START= /DNA_END= /DNA_ORIENTATION=
MAPEVEAHVLQRMPRGLGFSDFFAHGVPRPHSSKSEVAGKDVLT